MKLLKLFVLTIAFSGFIGNNANAQKEDWGSDSLKCRECLSLYGEPLNQKNYAEARTYWKCVVTVCPKIKESVYINGAIIYRHFIEKETDAATKEKLVDSLVWIYERRMEYFGDKPETRESFGNDMMKYRQDKPDVAYGILDKLINDQKGKSSAIAIMRYYQSCYLLYKKKSPLVDAGRMVNEYMRLSDYLNEYKTNNPTDPNIPIAEDALGKFGEPFLNCTTLYDIATKKFNTMPKDPKDLRLAEMKRLLGILNKKNCTENVIYESITEEVHKSEPSHTSAYSLGVVKANNKKAAEANTYFKQALELCGECEQQADYLLGIAKANLMMGNSSGAASYARQAMAKDSKLAGQAYIVIAKAIVMSQCGDSDYARKYLYILAVDYLIKAKNADPSVSGEANSLIGSYSSRFPTKVEIFERSDNGKEFFAIGCWINENARVPKD